MTPTGRVGVAGCAAVSALLAVALPVSLRAADEAACDSNGKIANLDFTLKDVHGKDVALSAFKGRVILLDFWATWCAPCKIEIPGFVEMYQQYGPKDFVVLGVSIDDTVARLKPFVEQFKMNYPVLVGLGHEDLQDAFGPLVGFPTAFLIDRDARICKQHVGFTPREQFEREIKALLARR
jgi:peroxiredoxin